jgi:hypothetical protein
VYGVYLYKHIQCCFAKQEGSTQKELTSLNLLSFLKDGKRFIESPCCLSVCLCEYMCYFSNFETIFTNFGMNVMPLENTPITYILISYNQ